MILFSTACPQVRAHRPPSSQPHLPTQKGTDGGEAATREPCPHWLGGRGEVQPSPGQLTRKPESGELGGVREADAGKELVQARRENQEGREVKEEVTNGMETG